MGFVIQSAVEVVVAGTEESVVALAVVRAFVRAHPLLPTVHFFSHSTPSEYPSNSIKIKLVSASAGAIRTEYPKLNPKLNPKPNMAHKPPPSASSGICSCTLPHHAEAATFAAFSPRTPCLRNRPPKCAHKPIQQTPPPPAPPPPSSRTTQRQTPTPSQAEPRPLSLSFLHCRVHVPLVRTQWRVFRKVRCVLFRYCPLRAVLWHIG